MNTPLTTIFLFLAVISFGQSDFEYSLGDPHKQLDFPDKAYFGNDGELISLKIHGRKSHFQKFSGTKLNESFRSEELELPPAYVLVDYIEFNDKLYHLYLQYDRKLASAQLVAREIDKQKAAYVGETIVLYNDLVNGPEAYQRSYEAYIIDGGDKLKILNYKFLTTDEAKKVIVLTFDKDLEEISNEEVEIEFSKKTAGVVYSNVDPKGNMYFSSVIETKENLEKKEKQIYNVEMICSNSTGESLSNHIANAPLDYIFGLSFIEIEGDGRMTAVGSYGNNKGGGAKGVFLNLLGSDGDIADQVFLDFPEEIILQGRTEKEIAKMIKDEDVSIPHLKVRRMVAESNGSITVLCEISSYSYTTELHTDEDYLMINMNFNGTKEGKVNWMKKMPKRNLFPRVRFGIMGGILTEIGDFFIDTDESYYILFHDHKDNAKNSLKDAPEVLKGYDGNLAAYKIDRLTGDVEKQIIMNTDTAVSGGLQEMYMGERVVEIKEGVYAIECFQIPNQQVILTFKLK